MISNEALVKLLKDKPWLLGTLTGAAVGAPVGLFKSEEGEGATGALGGALAGAGIGTAAGMGVDAIKRLLGSTGMGMAVGGAAGLGGGVLGAKKLAPWIRKRLMNQAEVEPGMEMPKEAGTGTRALVGGLLGGPGGFASQIHSDPDDPHPWKTGLKGTLVGGLASAYPYALARRELGRLKTDNLSQMLNQITSIDPNIPQIPMEGSRSRALTYALLSGGLGYAGGYLMRRKKPAVKDITEETKEANMYEVEDQGDEQIKQAELEKVAVARINSFDYGVELFCHENGINKQAFAEAIGFESADQMAPGIVECMVASE